MARCRYRSTFRLCLTHSGNVPFAYAVLISVPQECNCNVSWRAKEREAYVCRVDDKKDIQHWCTTKNVTRHVWYGMNILSRRADVTFTTYSQRKHVGSVPTPEDHTDDPDPNGETTEKPEQSAR